jgi:hypothetical protein
LLKNYVRLAITNRRNEFVGEVAPVFNLGL